MTSAPQIYAAGLVCPLGKTLDEAAQAYASSRYALKRDQKLYGIDALPITLAYVWPYDDPRDYAQRLALLLHGAAEQCFDALERLAPQRRIPFYILAPAWLRASPALKDFARKIGDPHIFLNPDASIHFGGHADFIPLMANVSAHIRDGKIDAALVCALDSFIEPQILDALSLSNAILNEENPYGFVPSEAGAALLLSNESFAQSRVAPIGAIGETATAQEAEDIKDPQGIIGRALAQCFEIAENQNIQRILIDLNGERWRAEEFGFALAAKAKAALIDCAANPDAPAAQMGDVGAATGAVLAALAATQNKTTLISTSSENGGRSVAIIQGKPQGKPHARNDPRQWPDARA